MDALRERCGHAPRNLAYFLREYTLPEIARFASQRVFRRQRFISPGDDPYDKTNFQPWLYTKGDTLPFDDGSLHYIFSEHFFNMLFFDEVMALLRECHRVLATSGVIRTIVPDSDLRTYEPPEPAGYPKRNIPFTDPRKNKTRYSVLHFSQKCQPHAARRIRRWMNRRIFGRKPAIDGRCEYSPCIASRRNS